MNTNMDTNPQEIVAELRNAAATMSKAAEILAMAAVTPNEGDLILSAMAYAVTQSNDPQFQSRVRALISKLSNGTYYEADEDA